MILRRLALVLIFAGALASAKPGSPTSTPLWQNPQGNDSQEPNPSESSSDWKKQMRETLHFPNQQFLYSAQALQLNNAPTKGDDGAQLGRLAQQSRSPPPGRGRTGEPAAELLASLLPSSPGLLPLPSAAPTRRRRRPRLGGTALAEATKDDSLWVTSAGNETPLDRRFWDVSVLTGQVEYERKDSHSRVYLQYKRKEGFGGGTIVVHLNGGGYYLKFSNEERHPKNDENQEIKHVKPVPARTEPPLTVKDLYDGVEAYKNERGAYETTTNSCRDFANYVLQFASGNPDTPLPLFVQTDF